MANKAEADGPALSLASIRCFFVTKPKATSDQFVRAPSDLAPAPMRACVCEANRIADDVLLSAILFQRGDVPQEK